MAQHTTRELTDAMKNAWFSQQGHIESTASGFCNLLYAALLDPTPHMVYYNAVRGKACYVSPDRIWIGSVTPSPSDCEWIVPTRSR